MTGLFGKNAYDDTTSQQYISATRLSPLKPVDKQAILKHYSLKVGLAKGKSDTDIANMAAKAVINKFYTDKRSVPAGTATFDDANVQQRLRDAGIGFIPAYLAPPDVRINPRQMRNWIYRVKRNLGRVK